MAEMRTKASTSDAGNTVEQSAAVRQATEDKLSSRQKDFDRKHQRNEQKLDKLSKELGKFTLSSISEKVRTLEDHVLQKKKTSLKVTGNKHLASKVHHCWYFCLRRYVVELLKVTSAPPVVGWVASTRMQSFTVEETGVKAFSRPLRLLSTQPVTWNRRS